MPIILLTAIAATILILASSMSVRTLLVRIFTRVGTAWNNNAPTWQGVSTVLRSAGRILLIVMIVFAAIFLILWFLFFIAMTGLGAYTGWWKSGILLGIFFPIWFLFFVSPRFMYKLPVLGRIMGLSRWTITPVVIACTAILTFALVAPHISKSLPYYAENKEKEAANSLDKSSAQSEPVSGIFAIVVSDTMIVNEKGEPVKQVRKGEVVRITTLEAKKATAEYEGMLSVRCQDKNGHYSGLTGLIPSRLLDWEWTANTSANDKLEKKQDDYAKADYNPAPAAPAYNPPAPREESNPPVFIAPAQKEEVKPVNISGNLKLQWCNEPPTRFEIVQTGNSFTGEKRYRVGGVMRISGSISGNHISGIWKVIGHPAKAYGDGKFSLDMDTTTSGKGQYFYGAEECQMIAYTI